jgi:hypothetical protein
MCRRIYFPICFLTSISYGVETKIRLMQLTEARENIIKKKEELVVAGPQMLI